MFAKSSGFIIFWLLISVAWPVYGQISDSMTFTTGATGHSRNEGNQTQQTEDLFLGVALYSNDQSPSFSQRRTSGGTNHFSEESDSGSKSIVMERGRSKKDIQVEYIQEYDFAIYNFSHTVDFEY